MAYPGRLVKTGLTALFRFFQQGAEGGSELSQARCLPIVTKYLVRVLAATKAGSVLMRTERELRSIS